ncbi:MAG TPA: N-acetylmuramoyl-L-alanine amidase [bacterium]|nr:N-acetylmuramoyl-L-alanine amidase [bacterium]
MKKSYLYRRIAASAALIAAVLLIAADAEPVKLYLGDKLAGTFTEFQVIDDVVFLPLQASAKALGIEGFADPQSGLAFFRKGRALVVIDSNRKEAKAGEHVTPLKYAPIWTGKDVFIPAAVFTDALPLVLGEAVRVAYPPLSGNGTALRNPVDVIVLDPGHGGHDAGAKGPGGILEKDVTLSIAKRLRDRLQKETGLIVYLTRNDDTFIPLSDRPKKARELNADVFISVHANAYKMMSAQGFETFFASLTATDKAAMDLAEWENQAEETSSAPASDEVTTDIGMILGNMAQTESLAASQQLAETIQDALAHVLKSDNRGVKQAPFRVLMDSTTPAVLVEVGFLTSPEEASLITNPAMQDRIVEALASAILKYRGQTNARLGLGPKE